MQPHLSFGRDLCRRGTCPAFRRGPSCCCYRRAPGACRRAAGAAGAHTCGPPGSEPRSPSPRTAGNHLQANRRTEISTMKRLQMRPGRVSFRKLYILSNCITAELRWIRLGLPSQLEGFEVTMICERYISRKYALLITVRLAEFFSCAAKRAMPRCRGSTTYIHTYIHTPVCKTELFHFFIPLWSTL